MLMHDNKAIGLVEQTVQTIKRRLVFIQDAAYSKFNSKASINTVIYQLRIGSQGTNDMSPFEAHFSRKPNTS